MQSRAWVNLPKAKGSQKFRPFCIFLNIRHWNFWTNFMMWSTRFHLKTLFQTWRLYAKRTEAKFNDFVSRLKCFHSTNWPWQMQTQQRFWKRILSNNNIDNRYDIVIGPIANDDLALLFRQFSDGLISVETLVKEMEFKKLTDQYSFHTQESISYLKKIGEEHV